MRHLAHRFVCGIAILLMLSAAAGCIGGGPSNQQAPIATTATTKEIDRALRQPLDGDKAAALANIARRPELSPEVQVHLVDVTMDHLAFDNSKMTVLVTLIENRAFSRQAKQHILDGLDGLTDMNPKQEVLYALDRRGQLRQ